MRPGLDELRERHDLADPYGVPTGAVPRVVTSGYIQVLPEKGPEGIALTDALADVSAAARQAVDNYLLMERKAKAFDLLLVTARCADSSISGSALAAKMEALLSQTP